MPLRLAIQLAAATSVMLVVGCQRETQRHPPKLAVLPVTAIAVEYRSSFSYPITYYGRVEPARRATLSFERPGRLEEVRVNEGQRIAAGQVLALLDTSLLEAEKNVLLTQRKTERALLDRLQRGERAEVIEEARAEVMRLNVELRRALTNKIRNEKVYEEKAIARAEVDQATYTYQAAEFALQQAEHRLEALESGSRVEDVGAQQSRVDAIDAQMELIDVQLKKMVLFAPFDAYCVKRHQDEGVTLTAGQSVLEINEANLYECRFSIPYSSIKCISNVESLRIDGKSYSVSKPRGIAEIDQTMRTVDILFPLQVDAAERVLPGQACTIELSKSVECKCMYVPLSALTASIRGLWSFYGLQPNEDREQPDKVPTYTVEKFDVTILHSDGVGAMVSATLPHGSLIIAEGVHKVVPGMTVRIVEGG
ncbi:HlyD family secretion protein [Novipirellula artificiosorum]|uniref:Putative efflux pump membrane fusion protein n=1 Tax=Novipirellula artificiosorum TaxID=2528016 RepID=A0A5C6DWE7_9BACT|nr:biotin/lipoyl-binding protein [Novipirellula artificiosorum]TWU39731.1 putative efflux pump membrane fusion protein [Novipirellula artificiosorum]